MRSVPGPREPHRVEAEVGERLRPRLEHRHVRLPGGDGIGLVEADGVRDGLPEARDVGHAEDGLRPALRRDADDGPRDGAAEERPQPRGQELGVARQGDAGRVEVVVGVRVRVAADLHHRGAELAGARDALDEPRRRVVERVVGRVRDPGRADGLVLVVDVDVARAAAIPGLRERAGERRVLDGAVDEQVLPLAKVEADSHDELRVALEVIHIGLSITRFRHEFGTKTRGCGRTVEKVLARAVTHALVGLEPRRVEVEAHVQRRRARLRDRRARRPRVPGGEGARAQRGRLGRARVARRPASPSTSRRPSCARRAPASTSRSRSRSSPRRGQVPADALARHAAVGELALDGRVRPVGGVLAVAEGARRAGLERMLCAAESAAEAALAGVEPVPVRHLAEAVAYLRGEVELPACEPDGERSARAGAVAPDLADVRGQERARRALEIAAAGGHNLLLAGPPGTGKTMLARRLPGILPPLDRRRGARGDADPLGRRAARAPTGRRHARRRSARRTTAPRRPRSSAAGPGRGRARRASRTTACCSWTSCRSSSGPRSRRCGSRSRTASSASRASAAGASFPARFQLVGDDEPVPVRRARRPGGGVHVLAAAARRVPRQALARAARPLRPRRRVPRPRASELAAAPAEASAPVRERVVAARERLARAAAPATREARRAARPRRRAAAALRPRPRARGAGRADGRGARGAERVAPEHVAEALPTARRGSWSAVSELAGSGCSRAEAPRPARSWRRSPRAFDEQASGRARGARAPLRGRRRCVPAAAARDPRPAAGAVRARRRRRRRARAAGGRDRRRPRVLAATAPRSRDARP